MKVLGITLPRPVALTWDALSHFQRDEGWMLSAYVAYAVLLAVFPFMIFLGALGSTLTSQAEIDAAVALMFDAVPQEVASAIEPVLHQVLGQDRGGLLTVAALGALWPASNGIEAFRRGFDRAWETEKPRHFLLARLVGMAFVVLGALAFGVMGFAIVLAPLVFRFVEEVLLVPIPFGVGGLRYLVALGVFVGFLWLLHRLLPTGVPRRAKLWPGIWATVVVWMAGATAFSFYLSNAPSFSATYGALAGVIVTLLFFYLTGAVLIFGAEVNAAIWRDAVVRRAAATPPESEAPDADAAATGADPEPPQGERA